MANVLTRRNLRVRRMPRTTSDTTRTAQARAAAVIRRQQRAAKTADTRRQRAAGEAI